MYDLPRTFAFLNTVKNSPAEGASFCSSVPNGAVDASTETGSGFLLREICFTAGVTP